MALLDNPPNTRLMTHLVNLDLYQEWRAFQRSSRVYASVRTQRIGFKNLLTHYVFEDRDTVLARVKFCADCGRPGIRHDFYTGYNPRGMVCYSCASTYSRCSSCSRIYAHGSTHSCDTRSCCSSAATTFRVHNGDSFLPDETRTTVSLPSGEISSEGIESIMSEIREYAASVFYSSPGSESDHEVYRKMYEVANTASASLGAKWQTKEGNYAKRLSRLAYKDCGVKIPADLMSQIGNIARAHSNGVDMKIDVTRKLNMPSREFANSGSCWWASYSRSRCALKTNGGFALRAFEPDSDVGVAIGRAWVIPLKESRYGGLVPTFNTEDPDAFILFNGYGTLQGYEGSRVLAQMTGMTYRKVSFSCSVMYINSGSGYLVAPEELASRYTDGSLALVLDQHSSLYSNEQREKKRQVDKYSLKFKRAESQLLYEELANA